MSNLKAYNFENANAHESTCTILTFFAMCWFDFLSQKNNVTGHVFARTYQCFLHWNLNQAFLFRYAELDVTLQVLDENDRRITDDDPDKEEEEKSDDDDDEDEEDGGDDEDNYTKDDKTI